MLKNNNIEIEKSEFIKEQRKLYSKKNSYTNNIEFEMIIEKIRQINDLMRKEE